MEEEGGESRPPAKTMNKSHNVNGKTTAERIVALYICTSYCSREKTREKKKKTKLRDKTKCSKRIYMYSQAFGVILRSRVARGV